MNLGDALDEADRISSSAQTLPNDMERLRQLLDEACEEARQAREDLEAELEAIHGTRPWAILLVLQKELIEMLRLYRFAAVADDATERSRAAMRMKDREKFRKSFQDTVDAALIYLNQS